MTQIIATIVLAAVTTLGLVGCGSDEPDPDNAETAEPVDTVDASDASAPVVEQEDVEKAARAYVDALASEDLVTMRRQQRAAADGSLAQAYIRHQANGAESDLDGGYPTTLTGEVTERDEGALRACYESEDDDSETTCYEYSQFKVNAAGEIVTFLIDGKTLKGRLSVGDGTATTTPLANFIFDSAYITQAGTLAVSGTIKTKSSKVFIEAGSNYRSATGRVRAMSSSSGLSEFPADSRSTFTAYFDGPIKFGGEMNLTFVEDGGTYSQAIATVKIR